MSSKAQCNATIYKRDTYRVSRTGGARFKMHYDKCQCSRSAAENGLCRQHNAMAKRGGFVVLWCAPAQIGER